MKFFEFFKSKKTIPAPWKKYYKDSDMDINIPDINMYDQVLKSSKLYPDNYAYQYINTKVTYKRFIKKIDKCAIALKRLGIRKGTIVTICLPNVPEALIAIYALNKIGAIANMIHPLSAEGEIKESIISTKSRYLIMIDMFYDKVKDTIKTVNLNKVIFVSEFAKQIFLDRTGWSNLSLGVCHNVINTDEIKELSKESIDLQLSPSKINMCSVGRLNKIKGYSRLVCILGELKNNITQDWQLYILGHGEEKQLIEDAIRENKLQEHVHLLGYDMNPYKYVSKMDLFICPSYVEGYSTAVTESIIVGTPVITTECSGMSEILGDSQAGIIVENSDDGLRYILKDLLTGKIDLDTLKVNAIKRSNYFNQSNIKEFEDVIN